MTRSLNATLTWLVIGAVAVGIVALVALVGISSVMYVVARDLDDAVESGQAAQEAEVQLLTYHETGSPLTKGVARAHLMRAIEHAARFAKSEEERRQAAELRESVEAYLRPGAGDAEITAALASARRLSLVTVEHARQVRARAEFWVRLSNVGGPAAAIIHVLGLIAFLVWLRRGPFRAFARLSRAMERFHGGDLDARAPESGAPELVAMARSFNTTAASLVQARQRQAEYVATAIHDLRTPLAAVQLAVAYFAPGRPLPPEPRIRELIELIGRQLTRLNGLTGDILGALWIEKGDLPLLREHFDLGLMASDSVTMFRSLAPEHVIELVTPPQPVVINGDRRRLAQGLNNLISNAVKYSAPGSRVRVSVSRAGEESILAVTDQGSGIAPEERERIFETFQRQSATHEEAPGTSLGLWVSRRVVEAHGGRVELESRIGQGSTFRFVLPAEPSPAEYPTPRPGRSAHAGSP